MSERDAKKINIQTLTKLLTKLSLKDTKFVQISLKKISNYFLRDILILHLRTKECFES